MRQKSGTHVACPSGSALSPANPYRKMRISHFGERGEKSTLSALIISSWPIYVT